MRRLRRLMSNKRIYPWIYAISILIALALIATIVLLIWQLTSLVYAESLQNHTNSTCPPNPCPLTTAISIDSTHSSVIVSSISSNGSMETTHTLTSLASTLPNTGTTVKKRTYRESCDELYDCYIEYGLLCVYGWNETKSCLCEGSHYWSAQQNKCLRKGEINDSCEIDYQCHREIGLVCDKPPGASTKICVCAASLYWAKNSNCGQTTLRRVVDCINEDYATTCLVLGSNGIYHSLTIRSVTEKELSFDWFLIDNRILLDLPQLSCTLNNETRYCFGLSAQDSQHPLKLAQFTRKGFHSIEDLGGVNRGTAFGLTNINNVSVYVRNSQNTLYRHFIVNDDILAAHDIALSTTGDPICYIHEVTTSRQTFCFARNSAKGLTEYAELSVTAWRATQLSITAGRLRNETAPVCSYVGQVHRYCFAIFENGQIYRILFNSNVWGSWQTIGNGQQPQFIAEPVFITSKSLNDSSSDQTCYLIGIDTNNDLHLSMNTNCATTDNFSEWTLMTTNLKFKQFDKTFRLRDGNVGVLGIDELNRPYYIFLNPKTNHFTSIRPAFTVKPQKFRP